MNHLSSVVRMPAALFAVLLSAAVAAAAPAWRPVDRAELASAPQVEADADVEILEAESIHDYTGGSGTLEWYCRLKVFTAAGVAAIGDIEVAHAGDADVRGFAARVIKPDGTIVTYDEKALVERAVVSRRFTKVRVRSLAIPDLAPGCVLEYGWARVHAGRSDTRVMFSTLFIPLRNRFPMRLSRIRARPDRESLGEFDLLVYRHNTTLEMPKRDKTGFYIFEVRNVPGGGDEEWMPQDADATSSIVLYRGRRDEKPELFWRDVAETVADFHSSKMKPDARIEALAAELGTGADDPMERLRRYHEYCRTRVKNLSLESRSETRTVVQGLAEGGSGARALDRGEGTCEEINMLFLALAQASGFDVRIARVADRSTWYFDESMLLDWLVSHFVAAVKVDGTWKFFDPGSGYHAFGTLPWWAEGVRALICDRKQYEFVTTSVAEPSASKLARRAFLELDGTGTLAGTVTLAYTGHAQAERRARWAGDTPETVAEAVRSEMRERMPQAELSDIVVSGLGDLSAPLTVNLRVRVPGYAEAVGDRLRFATVFFQKGMPAHLAPESRINDVTLPYLFSEEDFVEIKLPAGFVADEATAPQAFDAGKILKYRVRLALSTDGTKLTCTRLATYGGPYFRRSEYATLRQVFQAQHASDQCAVVLRRATPAAVPGS